MYTECTHVLCEYKWQIFKNIRSRQISVCTRKTEHLFPIDITTYYIVMSIGNNHLISNMLSCFWSNFQTNILECSWIWLYAFHMNPDCYICVMMCIAICDDTQLWRNNLVALHYTAVNVTMFRQEIVLNNWN